MADNNCNLLRKFTIREPQIQNVNTAVPHDARGARFNPNGHWGVEFERGQPSWFFEKKWNTVAVFSQIPRLLSSKSATTFYLYLAIVFFPENNRWPTSLCWIVRIWDVEPACRGLNDCFLTFRHLLCQTFPVKRILSKHHQQEWR